MFDQIFSVIKLSLKLTKYYFFLFFSAKLKTQVHNMRREGGAFVKAVQKKANPAVKSAVRSVRESSKTISYKGKSAMRDMRSKLPNDVMRGVKIRKI